MNLLSGQRTLSPKPGKLRRQQDSSGASGEVDDSRRSPRAKASAENKSAVLLIVSGFRVQGLRFRVFRVGNWVSGGGGYFVFAVFFLRVE